MNFLEMYDPMEWNGVILIGVVSIQAGLHRLLVYALQAAVQTHCFPQLASIQVEVVGLYVVCLQDQSWLSGLTIQTGRLPTLTPICLKFCAFPKF